MVNYEQQVQELQEQKAAIEKLKKRITKKVKTAYLKQMLKTNPTWALNGLKVIYSFQTADEQSAQCTSKLNDVGFTGVDAGILSSFAEQYLSRGSLSPKQMTVLMKMMPKYHRQLLMVSDQDKLESSIIKREERKLAKKETLVKALQYV